MHSSLSCVRENSTRCWSGGIVAFSKILALTVAPVSEAVTSSVIVLPVSVFTKICISSCAAIPARNPGDRCAEARSSRSACEDGGRLVASVATLAGAEPAEPFTPRAAGTRAMPFTLA